VTPRITATQTFDRRQHRVDGFSCGQETLDRWLRAYAGQSQRRDAARTFVTTDPDGNVVGYYTLVAAQVQYEHATNNVSFYRSFGFEPSHLASNALMVSLHAIRQTLGP
jgi:nuclear transport factor 2 (NTF2) superfamily protein